MVEGLGVQFGALKALDDVDIVVPAGGVMGLIGPNGAGKSTFVDAVSGFLPRHTGRVLLDGEDLAGCRRRRGRVRAFAAPTSRTACRRRSASRHTSASSPGGVTRAEIDEVLEFFGCPGARARLSSVDVGTRRLVEVAAAVLSRPRVLVLDEPAAGLSHAEHLALGERLRRRRHGSGCRSSSSSTTSTSCASCARRSRCWTSGACSASGPQADVLADPAVIKAYMGETEML